MPGNSALWADNSSETGGATLRRIRQAHRGEPIEPQIQGKGEEDVREQCAGTGVRQSQHGLRVFCGRGSGCVGSVPGNLGSVSDRMREGWNTDHADSATESE